MIDPRIESSTCLIKVGMQSPGKLLLFPPSYFSPLANEEE